MPNSIFSALCFNNICYILIIFYFYEKFIIFVTLMSWSFVVFLFTFFQQFPFALTFVNNTSSPLFCLFISHFHGYQTFFVVNIILIGLLRVRILRSKAAIWCVKRSDYVRLSKVGRARFGYLKNCLCKQNRKQGIFKIVLL